MEKKRHGCLTVYLIFMMVVGVIGALVYFLADSLVATGNPEIPAGVRPVFGVISLLVVGCAFALWKWKKWGFWGFVVIGVLGGCLNACLSRSFAPFIFAAAGISIMYGILHIGKQNQGWKQLD
jgi:hypothetical protein